VGALACSPVACRCISPVTAPKRTISPPNIYTYRLLEFARCRGPKLIKRSPPPPPPKAHNLGLPVREGSTRFSREEVSAMPAPMPSRVDPMLRKTAPSGASAVGLAMLHRVV
jgi:hypothetical protein